VIIDDLRVDSYPFNTLLGIMDRYGFRVEFKGGTRQLLAHVIVITAPMKPEEMFSHVQGEDISQLMRRLDMVEEIK